jgi:hypothetical protein
MNREVHVRFCEGLGCNSLGLLTYEPATPTSRMSRGPIPDESMNITWGIPLIAAHWKVPNWKGAVPIGEPETPFRWPCTADAAPVDLAPVAAVAQLDRVPRFERGGRGFESLRPRQSSPVCSGHIGHR